MKRQEKRFDILAIIAVTWALTSIVMTVLLLDKLGARGWLWLGIHHLFCLIGVSHEWRKHQRRVQEAKK